MCCWQLCMTRVAIEDKTSCFQVSSQQVTRTNLSTLLLEMNTVHMFATHSYQLSLSTSRIAASLDRLRPMSKYLVLFWSCVLQPCTAAAKQVIQHSVASSDLTHSVLLSVYQILSPPWTPMWDGKYLSRPSGKDSEAQEFHCLTPVFSSFSQELFRVQQ